MLCSKCKKKLKKNDWVVYCYGDIFHEKCLNINYRIIKQHVNNDIYLTKYGSGRGFFLS